MTVFTEGRLAAYERMMQDYGDRRSGKEADHGKKAYHGTSDRKVVQNVTAKAGDSHAGHQS